MRREFVVRFVNEDGKDEYHPMKKWLRDNPEYIPPGIDLSPSGDNAHKISRALKKQGWQVEETETKVIYTPPSHIGPTRPQTPSGQTRGGSLSRQTVGNAGLYYACYQLARRAWNVMPTSRNARGVDIILYSQDRSRFVQVQVKALSKRDPVPLGKKLDDIAGDFWLVVNNLATTPSTFVMKPAEVKNLAHRGEKEGRISYWLQPASYDTAEFYEAWDRIGRGDQKV